MKNKELELFLEKYRENVICVIDNEIISSIIYEVFKNSEYDVYMLKDNYMLDDINEESVIIININLEDLKSIKQIPHILIISNIYEENDLIKNIIKNQKKYDMLIYNYNNKKLREYIKENRHKQDIISVSLNGYSNIYLKDHFIYYNNKKLYDTSSKRSINSDNYLEFIMYVFGVSEIYYLKPEVVIDTINKFTLK